MGFWQALGLLVAGAACAVVVLWVLDWIVRRTM